jgi:hypothetical protein
LTELEYCAWEVTMFVVWLEDEVIVVGPWEGGGATM